MSVTDNASNYPMLIAVGDYKSNRFMLVSAVSELPREQFRVIKTKASLIDLIAPEDKPYDMAWTDHD